MLSVSKDLKKSFAESLKKLAKQVTRLIKLSYEFAYVPLAEVLISHSTRSIADATNFYKGCAIKGSLQACYMVSSPYICKILQTRPWYLNKNVFIMVTDQRK